MFIVMLEQDKYVFGDNIPSLREREIWFFDESWKKSHKIQILKILRVTSIGNQERCLLVGLELSQL